MQLFQSLLKGIKEIADKENMFSTTLEFMVRLRSWFDSAHHLFHLLVSNLHVWPIMRKAHIWRTSN